MTPRRGPSILKGAKGAVVAYDMDGKELWNKDVKGGVIGCAAIADGLVIGVYRDCP